MVGQYRERRGGRTGHEGVSCVLLVGMAGRARQNCIVSGWGIAIGGGMKGKAAVEAMMTVGRA